MPKRTVHTPLGSLLLTEEDGHLTDISWSHIREESTTPLLENAARELHDFLGANRRGFTLPYKFTKGTVFQQKVWQEIAAIPYGEIRTYSQLAQTLGSHARAVGTACGKNPLPILVPCHRVVGKSGKLRGYSGGDGVLTKELLLSFEKHEGERSKTTPIFDTLRAKIPQKPFYLMRHGQTDLNIRKILQGRSIDTALNKAGIEQAQRAGLALRDIFNPLEVWHSDMHRARQTAEEVIKQLSKAERKVVGHDKLAERSFGAYDGKSPHEVSPLQDVWQSNPEGETWCGFTHRLAHGLIEVLSQSKTTPLVVSHGAASNCITEFLADFPRDKFMNNCQIWYVEPVEKSPFRPWRIKQVYAGEK